MSKIPLIFDKIGKVNWMSIKSTLDILFYYKNETVKGLSISFASVTSSKFYLKNFNDDIMALFWTLRFFEYKWSNGHVIFICLKLLLTTAVSWNFSRLVSPSIIEHEKKMFLFKRKYKIRIICTDPEWPWMCRKRAYT